MKRMKKTLLCVLLALCITTTTVYYQPPEPVKASVVEIGVVSVLLTILLVLGFKPELSGSQVEQETQLKGIFGNAYDSYASRGGDTSLFPSKAEFMEALNNCVILSAGGTLKMTAQLLGFLKSIFGKTYYSSISEFTDTDLLNSVNLAQQSYISYITASDFDDYYKGAYLSNVSNFQFVDTNFNALIRNLNAQGYYISTATRFSSDGRSSNFYLTDNGVYLFASRNKLDLTIENYYDDYPQFNLLGTGSIYYKYFGFNDMNRNLITEGFANLNSWSIRSLPDKYNTFGARPYGYLYAGISNIFDGSVTLDGVSLPDDLQKYIDRSISTDYDGVIDNTWTQSGTDILTKDGEKVKVIDNVGDIADVTDYTDVVDKLIDKSISTEDEFANLLDSLIPNLDMEAIKTKFPFCIPNDIYLIFSGATVTGSEAPVLVIPMKINFRNMTFYDNDKFVTIDFSRFDDIIPIFRSGFLLLFLIGLLFLSINVFHIIFNTVE